MVKRNPLRSRRAAGIELFMECTEEALTPSQLTAQQVARYQYDQAVAKIRDAQAKARIGKATIINKVDNVGKVAPQTPLKTMPQNVISSPQKEQDRSTSPDIIFVGETPAVKPNTQVQQQQQQQTTKTTVVTSIPQTSQFVQPLQQSSQQMFKLVSLAQTNQNQWVMKPIANVMPQQQTQVSTTQAYQIGQPVKGTMGMGYKRPLSTPQQVDPYNRKKLKRNNENEDYTPRRVSESEGNGNWVPLDEYYYGKMEGDPTYEEEKGEFRFKCWYCNKMLYNNVKAMMHIQGHIDSSKQQNIDLSDLTQCKHCYKQFDTPFEMQTHVDKVHMSNSNVLLCRICDRDHESRQALTSHMRMMHSACEMPYTCQLCKFRSSMYSDVVDHFKKKHDSSQHLLCLYCLRVFVVKFVSQGWGTTQTYYGHLLKHQSKAQTKKCGVCRLAFFNAQEVKAHKQKHHGANQKAVLGTAAHSSKPDQVLIKVPSSSQNKHCVKSLNAPAVSKVLDFGGTTFPGEVHYYNCFECKMSMGTHDHYRKYVECSMCRFATICSIAYANHMMGFHSGQMSSLNLNIPWERKMTKPMYCLCGFSSRYGNKIANHLVFCMKSSCYEKKPEGQYGFTKREEEGDPRHKPGASLLDALGLVKRRTVTPRSEDSVYKTSEESPPKKEEAPKPSLFDPDYVPPQLHHSESLKTVKMKDSDTSKESDTSKNEKSNRNLETEKGDILDNSMDAQEVRISEKGDNSMDAQEVRISEKGDNSMDTQSIEMSEKGDNSENSMDKQEVTSKNEENSENLVSDEMAAENELLDANQEHQKEDESKQCKISEEDLLKDESENESVKENTNNICSDGRKEENDSETDYHQSDEKKDDGSNNENEDGKVKEISDGDFTNDTSEGNIKSDHSEIKLESEKQNENNDMTEKLSEDSDSQDEKKRGEESTVCEETKDKENKNNCDFENKDTCNEEEQGNKDNLSAKEDDKLEENRNEDDSTEHVSNNKDNNEESESMRGKKDEQSGEGSSKMESSKKSDQQDNKSSKSHDEERSHDDSRSHDDKSHDEQRSHDDKSHDEQRSHDASRSHDDKSHDASRSHDDKSHDEQRSHDDKSQDEQRSHDDKSQDEQRSHDDSRSHDDVRYHDKNRSHDDRRSHDRYGDERSHDRHHYGSDRSHGRHHYDDRSRHHQDNRYRRHDERDYDRGYHDNRDYYDRRDNRNYRREDRRYNHRGQYHGGQGYRDRY